MIEATGSIKSLTTTGIIKDLTLSGSIPSSVTLDGYFPSSTTVLSEGTSNFNTIITSDGFTIEVVI